MIFNFESVTRHARALKQNIRLEKHFKPNHNYLQMYRLAYPHAVGLRILARKPGFFDRPGDRVPCIFGQRDAQDPVWIGGRRHMNILKR